MVVVCGVVGWWGKGREEEEGGVISFDKPCRNAGKKGC